MWVCTNRRPDGNPKGSCAEKGSEALRDRLKSACKDAGLNATVRVMSSSCIDVCEHGIALAVMPDGALLGAVTDADLGALVEGLRTPGGVAAQPSLAPKRITDDGGPVVPLGRKPSPGS